MRLVRIYNAPHGFHRPAPPRAGACTGSRRALARTERTAQWTSEALLGEGREALIEHSGSVYRLRLTSTGKLILTKCGVRRGALDNRPLE